MKRRPPKLRPSRCSGCGTTALNRVFHWVEDRDTGCIYWACQECYERGIAFYGEPGKAGFQSVTFEAACARQRPSA